VLSGQQDNFLGRLRPGGTPFQGTAFLRLANGSAFLYRMRTGLGQFCSTVQLKALAASVRSALDMLAKAVLA
jgi:hypothetical protein